MALLGGDHHLMLERRAALALTAQDFLTALTYADRRCRIEPPPASHCFVLRAEAAWRLGRREAALDDLAEALAINPADLGANRRMLVWGKEDLRRQAAARLIAHEQDPAILRRAIAVLRDAGEQHWAAVSVLDSHVTGWVAWTASGQIEAAVTSEDASSHEPARRGSVPPVGEPRNPGDELSSAAAPFDGSAAASPELFGHDIPRAAAAA